MIRFIWKTDFPSQCSTSEQIPSRRAFDLFAEDPNVQRRPTTLRVRSRFRTPFATYSLALANPIICD
jgi:hypothetical protein